MKPDELIKYLQNQDPETRLPMDSKIATGQIPGIPGLPGMSEDDGHTMIKSPYPSLSESGDNEKEELFSDGGSVSSSSGTVSQMPDTGGESPIIVKLRELLMGKKGDIMSDRNNVQAANQVDNSYCNGGMTGYAKGGVVDKVTDYLSKTYGKAKKGPMIPDSTLQGFQNLVSSPTAQGQVPPQDPGYSMGGFPDDPLLSQPSTFAQALQGPQFNPQSGLPPAAPAPHLVAPPVQPPVHPPVQPQAVAPVPPQGPNPAAQYFQGQHNAINSYGPEQQLALQQALQKQRSGISGRLPVALGGLADALMQGVARAGNPGFADRIQGQQNELAKEQISGLENAGKTNKENVEANAQVDSMDPQSQLSKVAQDSYGPLLIKNGFKPQQVQGMSAKNIADLTGKTVDALKAESEAKMAAATLGLHAQGQAAEIQQKKEDLQQKKEESKTKALEDLANHSLTSWLPTDANKALKEQAGLDGANAPAVPQINSQVEYDSLPKGATFMWNGKQGRKP